MCYCLLVVCCVWSVLLVVSCSLQRVVVFVFCVVVRCLLVFEFCCLFVILVLLLCAAVGWSLFVFPVCWLLCVGCRCVVCCLLFKRGSRSLFVAVGVLRFPCCLLIAVVHDSVLLMCYVLFVDGWSLVTVRCLLFVVCLCLFVADVCCLLFVVCLICCVL